jgi:hypothetical protein
MIHIPISLQASFRIAFQEETDKKLIDLIVLAGTDQQTIQRIRFWLFILPYFKN